MEKSLMHLDYLDAADVDLYGTTKEDTMPN